MASAELSRRVGKVVGYPPLCEMSDLQRRGFHEELLDGDTFEDLPGKWRAAILKAEANRPNLRMVGSGCLSARGAARAHAREAHPPAQARSERSGACTGGRPLPLAVGRGAGHVVRSDAWKRAYLRSHVRTVGCRLISA
jgi:hypothetical protein